LPNWVIAVPERTARPIVTSHKAVRPALISPINADYKRGRKALNNYLV
jgi:hypothetical protein